MKLILSLLLLHMLVMPVSALEIQPPEVPDSGRQLMPEDTSDFSGGLQTLLRRSLAAVGADLSEALQISTTLICTALLLSLVRTFSGTPVRYAEIASALLISGLLLRRTDSLIHLGADTITELSEYGKLLFPVLTAALAAQGAASSSAALYAGTTAFNLILSTLIARLLLPLIYLFLVLASAVAALGQDILKKMRDFVKWLVNWMLKTILTVFTAYISITGVISGTTDAVALKAAKMTISSVIPVVGGILSDASEAILVSAGLVKNAAGIYGILAVLAVFLSPFLRIGIHYAILRITAALCGLFCAKPASALMEDFSTAMGLLLAMTASGCLMLLISTVCFMKGAA